MDFKNKKIYKKIKVKALTISHVCEVGVYLPYSSNIIDFINEGIPTTLVEPDPASIEAINKAFREKKNIKLHTVAVFDYNGTIELSQRNASTFVSSLSASPALVNENYQINDNEKFTVDCVKFNEIDDGTIDLLSVDTEGCEWYVLKYLTSRPSVISLETHGKYYTNAFIDEIKDWMRMNEYKVWYKDGSDTVFIKNNIFDLTLGEKLAIHLQNLKIRLIKLKKVFRFLKKKN
ncbi:hypothetical protein BH23BAC1_BH23BAC1_11210 [soil metagenome]